MKLTYRTAAILVLPIAACLGLGGAAFAEKEPGELCARGELIVMRVSRIVEGGSREGFDQAVDHQLSWYRAHGFTANRLLTADVLAQDAASKGWSTSGSEVMSLHVNPPAMSAIKTDSDWSAFVSEFKRNAVVETERTACLREGLAGR